MIYGVFLLSQSIQQDAGYAWVVLGLISLLLAIAHYVLLRLSDFRFWEVIRRAGNPPGVRRS